MEYNPRNHSWAKLKFISLTSHQLTLTGDYNALIQAASKTAKQMPNLQTMELWHCARETACIFRYECNRKSGSSILFWGNTWNTHLDEETFDYWANTWNLHLLCSDDCGGLRLRYQFKFWDKKEFTGHGSILPKLLLGKGRLLCETSFEQLVRKEKGRR